MDITASERAGIVCSATEPSFGAFTLEPEDAVEILSGGIVQSVAKDLHLLHEG